ncbi:MAG: Hpt domain-containing protein [Desulfobacterales bacterium]|nr:Hpt domain-containing protein [Desulfobacterales bacterium]
MDLKSIGAELGLEEDEFVEIVEIFIETAAQDITKLREAITAQDFEALTEAAHSLKGSAGNLGFNEIYSLSKKIEENARVFSIDGLSETLVAIEAITQEIERAVASHH